MNKDSLGDRMKQYESNTNYTLVKRCPVIVRLDGKAFHTFTKILFGKHYNEKFVSYMLWTMEYVVNNVQGCNFAFVQSDEISLLLTDYETIRTQGYFNYEINKIVSITASLASSFLSLKCERLVQFDSRAFNIPQDEVCNYFIWRQQDATRNAIQMAGREYFSHKELYKKSCNNIQEMLFTNKGINFNDYSMLRKRGACFKNKKIDVEIPIFTTNRKYVEEEVYVRED